MSKLNNIASMCVVLILMVSSLLLVSVAEGGLLGIELGTPECKGVIAVRNGDTCSGIVQMSQIAEELFRAINPNLNCDKLFVGQWLCVAGTV